MNEVVKSIIDNENKERNNNNKELNQLNNITTNNTILNPNEEVQMRIENKKKS